MNENLTIDDKYNYQILPDGEYETYCYKQELASYIGKNKKLYLHFKVLDLGENIDKEIMKVYNTKLKVTSGGRKSLCLSPSSDLAYDIFTLFPDLNRYDRLSGKIFVGKKFLVSTRVVKSDYKQRVKPKQLQYSVIDKILKVY